MTPVEVYAFPPERAKHAMIIFVWHVDSGRHGETGRRKDAHRGGGSELCSLCRGRRIADVEIQAIRNVLKQEDRFISIGLHEPRKTC